MDSLDIGDGGPVLLFGPTGCGKTTLLRSFNGLIPHYYGGTMGGRVWVDGMDTREHPPSDISRVAGTVFQDPENQFLMLSVSEEIAFGLRNAGMGESEVRREARGIAEAVGVLDLMDRNIFELSSGQRQLVAIASTMASSPSYLLLDEPTSQLDSHNAEAVMSRLRRMCSERETTAIISEHRIERSARYCSRFIGMEKGKVSLDGEFPEVKEWFASRGVSLDGRAGKVESNSGDTVLKLDGVGISYGEKPVLDDVSIAVREGELTALVGPNGSGKTTLLKSVMNFIPGRKGRVFLDGRDITDLPPHVIGRSVGYLSHTPLSYLFQPTLREEMLFTLRHRGAGSGSDGNELIVAATALGLTDKLDLFPRDFSCGERELAAIACTVIGDVRCLLLDEPTRGMDYWRKDDFMKVVHELVGRKRIAVLMATHDIPLVRKWAGTALQVQDGEVKETDAASLRET